MQRLLRWPGKIASRKLGQSQRNQYLVNIPVALLELIIVLFMRDPDTTFQEVKYLRLVSKAFNNVIAPKVLSDILLFKNHFNVSYNFYQLRTLFSTKKSRHLHTTKQIKIDGWAWLDGSYFIPYVELPSVRQLAIQNGFLALLYPIYGLGHPNSLPQRLYNHILRYRTRQFLTRAPKINLPSVRCVQWNVNKKEPKWISHFTVDLLLQLPQLDELVLSIAQSYMFFEHVFEALGKLRHLRRLKICIQSCAEPIRSSQITCVGQFVAGNPRITHLDVCLNSQLTLAELLGLVPADQPLKLQHLGIRWASSISPTIAPHIRSLVSIYFGRSGCLDLFLAEGVFPPIMGIGHMDERFIDYLNVHPRITSLQFDCVFKEEDSGAIFAILAKHSKTLTHFGADMHNFTCCLSKYDHDLLFLQCTNLKELVLDHDRYYLHVAFNYTALSIVSQLPRSLTLVLVYFSYSTNLAKFLDHCKSCQDPQIEDLGTRTVIRRRSSSSLWYKELLQAH